MYIIYHACPNKCNRYFFLPSSYIVKNIIRKDDRNLNENSLFDMVEMEQAIVDSLYGCSVEEFKKGIMMLGYPSEAIRTLFRVHREKNQVTAFYEKLFVLIALEKESEKNKFEVLFGAMNQNMPLDVIFFLLENGIRVNEPNSFTRETPLMKAMFLNTKGNDDDILNGGGLEERKHRFISLFTSILKHGGEFQFHNLKEEDKIRRLSYLKRMKDLVTILKENVPFFTEGQRKEWEMIRLELVC